jgi:hypothetical protein
LAVGWEWWHLYLTYWGFISAAVTYSLLWAAHRVNGDAERERYEEPVNLTEENRNQTNVFAIDREPWNQWWLITILYNWTISVNTTIAIAFWIVEVPYTGFEG